MAKQYIALLTKGPEQNWSMWSEKEELAHVCSRAPMGARVEPLGRNKKDAEERLLALCELRGPEVSRFRGACRDIDGKVLASIEQMKTDARECKEELKIRVDTYADLSEAITWRPEALVYSHIYVMGSSIPRSVQENSKTVEEMVRHHNDFFTHRLRTNYYRLGSTCGLSRAAKELQREACCRYLDRHVQAWVFEYDAQQADRDWCDENEIDWRAHCAKPALTT